MKLGSVDEEETNSYPTSSNDGFSVVKMNTNRKKSNIDDMEA